MPVRTPFWKLIAVAALLVAGAVSPAFASDPDNAFEPRAAQSMRVFIDPATGKLRIPTAVEAAELDRLIERDRARSQRRQVSIMQTSTGAVMAELDDSYMDYIVVSVGPSGRLMTACVKGPDSASQALAQLATTCGEEQ